MDNSNQTNLKPAFISFQSKNITDGYDIKFAGNAFYSYDKDIQIICYEETEEDFKGCKVKLTIENEKKITISRTGSEKATIEAELNKKHSSQYGAPGGMIFYLGIILKYLNSSLNEDGGKLHFRYRTESDFRVISDLEFNITIKVKQSK